MTPNQRRIAVQYLRMARFGIDLIEHLLDDADERRAAIDAALALFGDATDHTPPPAIEDEIGFGPPSDREVAEAVRKALPHTEPSITRYLDATARHLERNDATEDHAPAISLLRAIAKALREEGER